MKFTLQLIVDNEKDDTHVEDILVLDKHNEQGYCAGRSLKTSQQLLKQVQQRIVLHEVEAYCHSHLACPSCHRPRRIKGYHTIQYVTLVNRCGLLTIQHYPAQVEKPIHPDRHYSNRTLEHA